MSPRYFLIAAGVLLCPAAAFSLVGTPPKRKPAASSTSSSIARNEPDGGECLLDEPMVECVVRSQVDGPWADVWARYVLLRPGMSYSELKKATMQRNELDPSKRIPGTYRTVVIAHALCFAAAIPALLTNEAVFPKLLGAAAVSRAAAGI